MATLLDWRWAFDTASNRTRAGVVAATLDASGGTLTVFGVTSSKYLRKLQCSLDGEGSSSSSSTWVPATSQTAIPESDFDPISFSQRYKRKWPPGGNGPVEGDSGFFGVRFRCAFGGTVMSAAILRRATLSVRVDSSWRIDGVRIRCPGYPIAEGEPPACSSASALVVGGSQQHEPRKAIMHPFVGVASNENTSSPEPGFSSSAAAVDVTVCVQYVYGTGYSARTLIEFAAWYLLLGARRIVIFDSMEPHLEVGETSQRVARERMQALHALSASLGDRFVVVRGLAVWDAMRRARFHMSGQSVAGNMCKAAAGALAPRGHAAYAVLPDLDELLSPPPSDAAVPRRLATRLAGSLRRLARYVHGGRPATGLYLSDGRAVHSRVHRGGGTQRCLSFASIYYWPPECDDKSNLNSSSSSRSSSGGGGSFIEPQPSVLRRLWRGHPDNFERGPSHNWTHFPHWNFFVRSKFLVEATDDDLLTSNHECCCKSASVTGKQCTTRSGALGNHTCATLEFMPLEHWHVRHLKGSGLSQRNEPGRAAADACRKAGPIPTVLAAHGRRERVQVAPVEETFPATWATEYTFELARLARLLETDAARASNTP